MIEQKDSHKLFLLEDSRHYDFKIPFQKIIGCCPMFNKTLVVVGIKCHRTEYVGHFDAEGNIIKEKLFKDSNLQEFVTPSDREIAWVDEDRDVVCQWNLETDEYLEFDYKLNIEKADHHSVFYFPETKLIVVHEHGRKDSNFFKLSYYKFPLTKESEPIHEFESEDCWTYEHMVRRANNRSGFVWFTNKAKENVTLKYYELEETSEGQYKENNVHTFTVANNFKHNGNVVELSIGNVWELTPRNFLFVCITSIPEPDKEEDYPNGLFVLDANTNTFRQANFSLDGKFRLQIVDYISFGATSMIRGFDFVDKKAVDSPVYYIDNLHERIVATSTWKIGHLSKYHVPGYDANSISENRHENGDVKELDTKVIKVVEPNEIKAFLLEGIIPDVDQDLCKDIVENLELKV